MTISPEVLKTCSTTQELADTDLKELGAEIMAQLAKKSSFVLEGVGTFSKVDGALSFKADSQLISSVNYRYLGLPIMDITGTVVSTEEPEEAELPADIDFDDLPDLPDATPISSSPTSEATPIKVEADTEESEPPAEQNLSEEEQPVAKQVPNEVPAPTVVKSTEKPLPKRRTPRQVPVSPPKNNNQTLIVVAILLVIAVIVSVLTIFNQNEIESPDNIIADNGTLEEIILEMDDVPTINWGLNGELDNSLPEYYTIVLFSLRNRTNAYQMKDNLSERGFRAFIQEITIEGQQAFRVAVGQFPDTGMAQDSAAQLPEDLRSSYFLRKIQKN